MFRAAIVIVSDTVYKDPATDKCASALLEVFTTDSTQNFDASTTSIVPDDVSKIQHAIMQKADGSNAVNLIVTCGGTGFSPRDLTPEVSSIRL